MKKRIDISLNDRQSLLGRRVENDILNKMHKDIFIDFVKECEIRLEYLFTKTKLCVQDYHNFNLFLRKLKEKYGVNIYETMLFMEDYYVKFKKILSMLDADNAFELKKEMSKKYNIKILTTTLPDFLEEFEEDQEKEPLRMAAKRKQRRYRKK